MADYLTPDQRRRIAGGLMAAQYAENPPAAPMGYDFDAAPLSPSLMNFAAQRGQPGVIQKTLGLIPGFDQSGARGRQSWGNALMSTAQFPIDAVAGMGQAITAPARAYRGEFDPTSEEGVGEALNVAGNAMMGGLAAPKPRNVVGSAGGDLKGAALGAIPDTPGIVERGYRGTISNQGNFTKENSRGVWGSSDRDVANTYAIAPETTFVKIGPNRTKTYERFTDGEASVMPAEFRFNNPMVVDAGGANYKAVPFNGMAMTSDQLASLAKTGGNDGLVIRNVRDTYRGEGTPATTYKAIERGTVYSPLTGDLLYANGGRPGAATGAALGDPQSLNDPTLAEILRQYGIDVPSRPASPRYRPGDA